MPKTNPQSLAGLTAEEQRLYERVTETQYATGQATVDRLISALESLSRCRASEARKRKLLEKHQWVWANDVKTVKYCPECDRRYVLSFIDEYPQETWEHNPDCAIAAELAGTGE